MQKKREIQKLENKEHHIKSHRIWQLITISITPPKIFSAYANHPFP